MEFHGTSKHYLLKVSKMIVLRFCGTYGCIYNQRPSNNAIKADMLIIDKEGKKISLIEGTICAPGCVAKREKEKQDKYSEMRKSMERLNRR